MFIVDIFIIFVVTGNSELLYSVKIALNFLFRDVLFQILPPPAYYSSAVLNQESDFDIMVFDSVTQLEHTLVSGQYTGDEYYPSARVEFVAAFLSESDEDDS